MIRRRRALFPLTLFPEGDDVRRPNHRHPARAIRCNRATDPRILDGVGEAMGTQPGPRSDLDEVLRASRVFVAVVAKSMAEVEELVTGPQWRVLILIATRGPQTPGAVAADLDVHPSSATRTCDRLVAAGLVRREEAPGDRRFVSLQVTAEGRALVDRVMSHRRHALEEVVDRMEPEARRMLAAALSAFAEAAGEVPDEAMTAARGLG